MRCFVIFTQQVDLPLNGYLEILTTAVRKWWSYLAYRGFSRCVTSAIWVCKKQDELNLVLMQKRSFHPITLRSCWSREWKHCTSSMVRNPSPGDSYIKVTSMLVVSLWGVNCRVWSHLGCLGWKVTIFVLIQVSFRTVCKENYKKCPDTDHTEISFRGQPAPTPLGV